MMIDSFNNVWYDNDNDKQQKAPRNKVGVVLEFLTLTKYKQNFQLVRFRSALDTKKNKMSKKYSNV